MCTTRLKMKIYSNPKWLCLELEAVGVPEIYNRNFTKTAYNFIYLLTAF